MKLYFSFVDLNYLGVAVVFMNVTLLFKDGQSPKAHNVILSATSPFFGNIPNKNITHHPLKGDQSPPCTACGHISTIPHHKSMEHDELTCACVECEHVYSTPVPIVHHMNAHHVVSVIFLCKHLKHGVQLKLPPP